jgi:hypothetical protein
MGSTRSSASDTLSAADMIDYPLGSDWTPVDLICAECGQQAVQSPIVPGVVGCRACNFRTYSSVVPGQKPSVISRPDPCHDMLAFSISTARNMDDYWQHRTIPKRR